MKSLVNELEDILLNSAEIQALVSDRVYEKGIQEEISDYPYIVYGELTNNYGLVGDNKPINEIITVQIDIIQKGKSTFKVANEVDKVLFSNGYKRFYCSPSLELDNNINKKVLRFRKYVRSDL